ncbi:MAG: PD40 domain-containing protein, partial [Paucibacter sp.]|nr:PD40 domain-containing protein [Roseateles sp.]
MASSRIRRSTIALLLAALPWASAGAAEPGAALGPIEHPLWLRHSAISPDGQSIAFAFEGNLFVVPVGGGQARLLVGNGHHNTEPVWSPDSRTIAYASDVNGNFDVFAIAAEGGPARRLTTHSAAELPLAFTPDGAKVLFSAQRMDTQANIAFPSAGMTQLYEVDVAGGHEATQVFSTPALAGRFDRSGARLVYEDWKGYENAWRKHHVAPVARDVWIYDVKTGQHRKLTGGGVENRNPVWAPDQKTIYFLSEKSGSFNVWKMSADAPDKAEQVTHYTTNPVRFLSMADNGVLSFGYDGELYTMAPGAEPHKVAVSIGADTQPATVENLSFSSEATEVASSPDGDEIAFVVRGQVFVASTEFGNTRRITNGPGQKRTVDFSPDGRRIVFASEHDGHWRLEEAEIVGSRKEAPHFFDATEIRTKTLLENEHQNFQPRYSPDGKEVAYLEDRVAVRVLDRASGKSREVMAASHSYSYEDGDQWFAWSPDGKSLLVNYVDPNRWSSEVGLVSADGSGTLTNLSQSGYEDVRPIFARKGQIVLWMTDRWGLHGAPNSASQADVEALFLTRAAYDRFQLDKAEYAALKKREDDAEKDGDKKDGDKKDGDKKDDKKDAKKDEGKDGRDAKAEAKK